VPLPHFTGKVPRKDIQIQTTIMRMVLVPSHHIKGATTLSNLRTNFLCSCITLLRHHTWSIHPTMEPRLKALLNMRQVLHNTLSTPNISK
jgi:hypothetical protein